MLCMTCVVTGLESVLIPKPWPISAASLVDQPEIRWRSVLLDQMHTMNRSKMKAFQRLKSPGTKPIQCTLRFTLTNNEP
ncbi:hypothetical protein FGIG_08373 [Fasciola gigantica]|uniref:Uncharacterized protein n=1 Tax=Fasciola gigantica TaxID=46835 RepID=A0A504YFM9_FASGI|nr:hypothetical protein FGIG_08373 [Fasciola gigantica]